MAGSVQTSLARSSTRSVAARGVAIVAVLLGTVLRAAVAAHAPFVDAFLYALGVMVALVPEGLPAVMSVSLAIGVQRLAAVKALMKRLCSVETLGSTTVICTDKTGTLTAGEMTVSAIWSPADRSPRRARLHPGGPAGVRRGTPRGGRHARSPAVRLRAGPLCNDARLVHDEDTGWGILGDPTEGALLVLAEKAGYDVEASFGRAATARGALRLRAQAHVGHRAGGRPAAAYVKGGPAEVLSWSARLAADGVVRELGAHERQAIQAAVDDFAGQALRVLAMATREPDPGAGSVRTSSSASSSSWASSGCRIRRVRTWRGPCSRRARPGSRSS